MIRSFFVCLLLWVTPFLASQTFPVPLINQPLVPDAVAPGGAGFTLEVNGTGFVSSSVVNWNGKVKPTQYISNSKLEATILASDIAVTSTGWITVVNPSPGGKSNVAFLNVTEAESSITFNEADYSTGTEPSFIATADLNGDGKLDLVITNFNGGGNGATFSVFLGNGDGTFQPRIDIPTANQPRSVVVGDFNGDGKLDLAVADSAENTVSIWLGNGDGTFQFNAAYRVASMPYSLGVGDFNGDGMLDIAARVGGTMVSVIMGNGDGTFQQASSFPVGNGDYGIAVGDFNGDGTLDLAVVNDLDSSVSILIGNADGTFQSQIAFATGTEPTFVSIGDFNGDGKLDLAIPSAFGTVSILLGNGDGSFQPHIDYATGGSPRSLALGDFNGDGNLDLSAPTYEPGYAVAFLLGNGDGTFQQPIEYPIPLYGGPEFAVAGDFNGDGILDVAVTNINSDLSMLLSPSVTTTILTSSPNPSTFSQSVTLTATVTAQDAKTPNGSVTFSEGSTVLGTAALNGGMATFVTTILPVGRVVITAAYPGNANFSGSSASLSQTVNQATTTLKLSSSLNPSGLGQPVTFTATIAPQYGGQATGTVTFKDGSATLGSLPVSGNAASLTTSGLAIGTHSITAVYGGDSNFTGSTSNTVSQVVTKAITTTILLSSINPSVQGKPVTFTATVSSLAGTPTGKVQFLNGKTVLATKALTSGSTKYTTSTLPPGSNSITAVYLGDSKNNGSTSAPVNQFVLAATTTTLTSSPNPSKYGQAVTFTAKVGSSIGAPPNGETVTFKKGTTVLGTGTINGGSATFTISTLKVGTTSVTAVYGGDSNFGGSKSNAVKQVVNR